ncbi:MAG: flagellar export chaperone FliS [Terracidiphilus sp.]|jgi:flagellar protein FliS
MSPTEIAYRKTSLGGASGFGLLIALYDTLAGDLRRAAEAERRNDIGTRCLQVNHALLVIAYLEDWIDRGTGGDLARNMKSFYALLRRKLIEAQAKRSATILEEQMKEVLDLRSIWQAMEQPGMSTTSVGHGSMPGPNYPGSSASMYESTGSRWSA